MFYYNQNNRIIERKSFFGAAIWGGEKKLDIYDIGHGHNVRFGLVVR